MNNGAWPFSRDVVRRPACGSVQANICDGFPSIVNYQPPVGAFHDGADVTLNVIRIGQIGGNRLLGTLSQFSLDFGQHRCASRLETGPASLTRTDIGSLIQSRSAP